MQIQPSKETVLIEAYDYISINESPIYLHGKDLSTSVEAFAKVLDCDPDNEQGVQVGDVILVDKNVGFPFQIDGSKYRLILYKQVLATLKGVDEEQQKRREELNNENQKE